MREGAAPYGAETVDKVSVSLPPGQAGLDAALEADHEESARAAEAFLPYAAALFAEAEW